jgi:hypothetical protein
MNRAAMLARPRFRTGDYLVTRRGTPSFVDGIQIEAEPETFQTGDASLQPASDHTLRVLPEGIHADGVRDLWTTAALRAVPTPDVLTIDGEPWAVFSVRTWSGLGGTHYIVGVARQVTP